MQHQKCQAYIKFWYDVMSALGIQAESGMDWVA